MHAIPESWNNDLSDVVGNIHNIVFQEHHLIRKHYMYFIERLSSKEIYNFLSFKKKKQLHQNYIIKRSLMKATLTGKRSTC